MKLGYTKFFILNYIMLFILEFLFKTFVMQTFDIGYVYILIFTIPFALLITFFSSLFNKKNINRIISIIIWFAITFIFIAETVYFSFYKTLCGLSALSYGGQVMEFFNSIMVHVKMHAVLLVGYAIPFIIFIVLSFKNKIKFERFRVRTGIVLFVSTILLSLSTLSLKLNIQDEPYNLFFDSNDIMQTTNKLGINTGIVLDAFKYLTKFEETITVSPNRTFIFDEKIEYNTSDIDFDYYVDSTSDSTLKTMHNYFKNVEPTKKNEYTGMFAGKNLIFIVAEGFYPIAVDKDVTPTLYKLVNNGFVFNNFYQPIYNCSTSDGEFINDLSILPGVATCSMKQTSEVYLPYALGNIMKDYGYNTFAFHGWTYTYYGRNKTHPNMGYTYYGYDRYKTGYKYALDGIKDSWPTSDIDVANSSYKILKDQNKFVAYYMSISGHLEYNFTGGNAMSNKNKNVVSGMKASDKIKAYVASQVEFDRSLEILINDLKEDGKLDDTVIVISADHYPYGLSSSDIEGYLGKFDDETFDLYKNNLVIYNSAMDKQTIDKYTSSLDVLPTVLNLFGVEYDSRLLIGRDALSDASDLVIFNNKSWITDKGRYNYMKKKFTAFTSEKLPDDYINMINKEVELKFKMSKLLISKDYYRSILGG